MKASVKEKGRYAYKQEEHTYCRQERPEVAKDKAKR